MNFVSIFVFIFIFYTDYLDPNLLLSLTLFEFLILKLKVWDREKIVVIPDHYIFTNDERANRNVDILREFCTEQNVKYFYDIKDLGNFKVKDLVFSF